MSQFKLVRGAHIGPDAANPKIDRIYEQGEVVESSMDLTKIFNKEGFPPKFERLHETAPTLPAGAAVFNPATETLEEFVKRMQPMHAHQGTADSGTKTQDTAKRK